MLSGTLLEVDWKPGSSQRMQKVLLQRSSRRVEELKSKRARSKKQLEQPRLKARPAEPSQSAVNPALSLRKSPQAEAPGMRFTSRQWKNHFCINGVFFSSLLFRHNRRKEARGVGEVSKNSKVKFVSTFSRGPEPPSSDPQLLICADCTSSWRRCSSRRQSGAGRKQLHKTG